MCSRIARPLIPAGAGGLLGLADEVQDEIGVLLLRRSLRARTVASPHRGAGPALRVNEIRLSLRKALEGGLRELLVVECVGDAIVAILIAQLVEEQRVRA